ncbi:MAG: HepT-like ribonuclease domain-containing protein [Cyanobacterium sp.]
MLAKHDRIRLQHMLDASLKAISFIEGKSFSDLGSDDLLVFALVKAIEIVGEAAGKVSKKYQLDHPEISWTAIISMRNRLVHAYFDINKKILWQTLKQDIPELINILTELLQEQ